MQVRIPAVYMRGGTSKAVFFHENHLPKDQEAVLCRTARRLMDGDVYVPEKYFSKGGGK